MIKYIEKLPSDSEELERKKVKENKEDDTKLDNRN
jgi:hypothetical protein